jgi:DUF4097 and DUF4098 domain-containing protein YvlB
VRGHLFTFETSYISPQGVRGCRICREINTSKSKATTIEKVRERDRIIHARKYQENRESLIEKQKAYHEQNREKDNTRARLYYQQNKDKWKKSHI